MAEEAGVDVKMEQSADSAFFVASEQNGGASANGASEAEGADEAPKMNATPAVFDQTELVEPCMEPLELIRKARRYAGVHVAPVAAQLLRGTGAFHRSVPTGAPSSIARKVCPKSSRLSRMTPRSWSA